MLLTKPLLAIKIYPSYLINKERDNSKKYKVYKKVIPQKTLDYTYNLNLIKPDFVVHGDDWKIGVQKPIRLKVIKTLKKWGGKLIEPKYTKNISSTIIKKRFRKTIWRAEFLD